MKYLVIIPAYNEEESIVKTINKLKETLNQNKKYHVDYIVVNDGSVDNTKKVLEDNNILHINHIINMGVGAAIKSGIYYSIENNYDAVMQFDADGQHNPEYIFDLIDELNNGYDIVIGSRFLTEKKPHTLRMLGSNILSVLIRLKSHGKLKVTDPTSGQRIIGKKLQKIYLQEASSSEPAFIIKYYKRKFKIKEIQVKMNEREAGESHFNIMNSIKFMLEQSLAIILGY